MNDSSNFETQRCENPGAHNYIHKNSLVKMKPSVVILVGCQGTHIYKAENERFSTFPLLHRLYLRVIE